MTRFETPLDFSVSLCMATPRFCLISCLSWRIFARGTYGTTGARRPRRRRPAYDCRCSWRRATRDPEPLRLRSTQRILASPRRPRRRALTTATSERSPCQRSGPGASQYEGWTFVWEGTEEEDKARLGEATSFARTKEPAKTRCRRPARSRLRPWIDQ